MDTPGVFFAVLSSLAPERPRRELVLAKPAAAESFLVGFAWAAERSFSPWLCE